LAGLLRTSLRAGDLVARIGGDEFGILMLGADERRAADVARRIREATARHPGVDHFRLSASVGHSTRPAAAAVDEAARSADMQMYLEKRARTPCVFELDRLAALSRREVVEAG
nr:diguanylate cyclase [Actinomycetota bacterium]